MFSKQSCNSEKILFSILIFRRESITFGRGQKYIYVHQRTGEQVLIMSWADILSAQEQWSNVDFT